MDNHQIARLVSSLPEMNRLYKGCFYNKSIPRDQPYQKDYFFIVNTIQDIRKMGHWVLFFIRNFHLYFFDSFAMTPSIYGGDISNFFNSYHGYKTIVFKTPIQNDFSYVCGTYTIILAYFMTMDNSIPFIKSMFTRNTCKNDNFVVAKLYSLTGFTTTRDQLSSHCYHVKCKKFCEC